MIKKTLKNWKKTIKTTDSVCSNEWNAMVNEQGKTWMIWGDHNERINILRERHNEHDYNGICIRKKTKWWFITS